MVHGSDSPENGKREIGGTAYALCVVCKSSTNDSFVNDILNTNIFLFSE